MMPPRKRSVSTCRSPRRRKRRATLFDAVQGKCQTGIPRCHQHFDLTKPLGRVTQSGLVDNLKGPKAGKKSLRPDEVLFKRKNAPVRYEEDDYYPAHTKLAANQQLPSGDLAAAIHGRISHLYSKADLGRGRAPWKCMKETALIAMGILMEETARSVLGETGDLAFTEADQDDDHHHIRHRQNEWTMSAERQQTNSSNEERRPTSQVQQPTKSRHDSWTWSDESSVYTSDDSVETD